MNIMKIKIIIISCAAGLLMFSLIFAQSNETRTNNSNSVETTNSQVFSINSNTAKAIQAKQEREKEFSSYLACQYLTEIDAKVILQSEVYGNGVLSSFVDKNYFCNYSAVGENNKNQVSVRLDIQIFSSKSEADLAFTIAIKKYHRIKNKLSKSKISTVRELNGIGDRVRLAGESDTTSLYFQKDNINFELVVYNKKRDETLIANLKLLAVRIAENFDPTKY